MRDERMVIISLRGRKAVPVRQCRRGRTVRVLGLVCLAQVDENVPHELVELAARPVQVAKDDE